MKRVRAALRLKTIRSRIVSMELIIIIPALILLGVLLYQQMGNLLIKTIPSRMTGFWNLQEEFWTTIWNITEIYLEIFFLMIRCRRYWKAIKLMSRKMG